MKFSNIKNKRGSVLFIVLLIMSVLIVLASAVYLTVNSNYENIVADYEEKQTYQTALSVNNIIDSYVSGHMESTFVQKMIDMNVNDAIYSSSSLGASQPEYQEFNDTISAYNFGKYSVTITKKAGGEGDTQHVFQIVVETELDGQMSKTTSWCTLDTGTTATFNRFFTSTGYTPQDVTISGTRITSTMYLDNEYTRLSIGSHLNINNPIICSGTLYFDNVPTGSSATLPFDITVGNNFIINGNQGNFDLHGGTLRVGANWVCSSANGYSVTNNTTVYVMGDCIYGANGSSAGSDIYVNGDMLVLDGPNFQGNVYVNGDLILAGATSNHYFPAGKMHVTGKVYVRNDYGHMSELATRLGIEESAFLKYTTAVPATDQDAYSIYKNFMSAVKIEKGNDPFAVPTPASWASMVADKINTTIGNYVYTNWDLKYMFLNSSGTDASGKAQYNNPTDYKSDIKKYSIKFNQTTQADRTANEAVIRGSDNIKYDSWSGWDEYNQYATTATIYQNSIIDLCEVNHNQGGNKIVYFDTNEYDASGNLVYESDGVTPKYHDLYIYLAPNPDGSKKFTWNSGANRNKFTVLTKGRGSVVFVLSEGTTYVAPDQCFVGHEGWYLLRGMGYGGDGFTENLDSESHIKESVLNGQYGKGSGGTAGTYIHNNIFLVAIDVNSELDFNNTGGTGNTFCGFVYAPYMEFGTSNSAGSVAMVGGVISSSYTMEQTSRMYICTRPYDYYTADSVYRAEAVAAGITDEAKIQEYIKDARSKVLERLMQATGCTTPLSPTTSKGWKVYGYN